MHSTFIPSLYFLDICVLIVVDMKNLWEGGDENNPGFERERV